MAKERVSLYFNTDIPLEKAMWEFISKDGRKSQKIKRAIEDAMKLSYFELEKVEIDDKNKNDFIVENEEDDLEGDDLDEVLL